MDLSKEQEGDGGHRHRRQTERSRRSRRGTGDTAAIGGGCRRAAIRARDRGDANESRARVHILSQQRVGGWVGAAECRLELAVSSLGHARGRGQEGHLQLTGGSEQATSGRRGHRHLHLLCGDARHGGHV